MTSITVMVRFIHSQLQPTSLNVQTRFYLQKFSHTRIDQNFELISFINKLLKYYIRIQLVQRNVTDRSIETVAAIEQIYLSHIISLLVQLNNISHLPTQVSNRTRNVSRPHHPHEVHPQDMLRQGQLHVHVLHPLPGKPEPLIKVSHDGSDSVLIS